MSSAHSFGRSEMRKKRREGFVHLDVNGDALSIVPQLKFNEAFHSVPLVQSDATVQTALQLLFSQQPQAFFH